MSCNNTLTDDQLAAMFAMTDEKMQQIEQPMECLIERTQHQCKMCTRFFSNKATLKQHYCEPPIQKEKWPHCSKAINHANNLDMDLRSCIEAPADPTKQQLRKMMLDGPTSSENGPSTLKKLVVEEMQVGVITAEHAEYWKAPEIVESTLKYTVLSFRKTFNSNNKGDVRQWLKDVIHIMRPVIQGKTWANAEAFKWYLSLNMNFYKSTSPAIKADLTLTFHSEVFKSIDSNELNYQFYVGYNQVVQQAFCNNLINLIVPVHCFFVL